MDAFLLITASNINRGSGGIERYINEQIRALNRANIPFFVVFPIRAKISLLNMDYFGFMEGRRYIGALDEKDIGSIAENLSNSDVQISTVIIHSLMNADIVKVSRLIEIFKPKEVTFFLHDFFSCCLQHNLMKNGRIFCKNAKLYQLKCGDCAFYKESIKHKNRVERLLRVADRYGLKFIAPSEVVKELWSEAYPEYKNKVFVLSHLKAVGEWKRPKCVDASVKIAYVGTQTENKGWDKWVAASNRLIAEGSPYDFYYFGESKDNRHGITNIDVSTSKMSRNAMIDALRNNGIGLVVLFSCWPETYSYTYSEASAADCFVITTSDSGNIARMVKKNGNGVILDDSSEALFEYLNNYDIVQKQVLNYQQKCHYVPLGYEENVYIGADSAVRAEQYNNEIIHMNCDRKLVHVNILKMLADFLYRIKYHRYLRGV